MRGNVLPTTQPSDARTQSTKIFAVSVALHDFASIYFYNSLEAGLSGKMMRTRVVEQMHAEWIEKNNSDLLRLNGRDKMRRLKENKIKQTMT